MSSYDLYGPDGLVARGMAPVARLLISRAEKFETATYGEARRMLESELDIERIFSTHPGAVVGSMMSRFWEYDNSLPPLNVLMVNRGGAPGTGADSFIAEWSGRRYAQMSKENRARILTDATRAVWAFKSWKRAYEGVFSEPFMPPILQPISPTPGEYGGPAESEEHRRLKHAVADQPDLLPLVSSSAATEVESRLRSGDEVDVRIVDLSRDVECAVEVKSIRSTNADLERGIYQAVKYRAVIEAQYKLLGAAATVIAVLVTERPLPEELRAAAKSLDVKVFVLQVNQQVTT